MGWKAHLILLYAVLLSLFACSDTHHDVAVFQGGNVSLSELTGLCSTLGPDERAHLQSKDDYFKFVRKIAIEKIILNAVHAEGMDTEQKTVDAIEGFRKNIAFDILREKNVLQKVQVVESDYEKYTNVYEVYQIVQRTDTLNTATDEKARKLLAGLIPKIRTLDDFKNYAQKYSEDVTASEGGYLGTIRAGIMDDEIDKVMTSIKPGTISDVIETYAGLHLIWVNSVTKVDKKELFNDHKLYETIYNDKVEKTENDWYEKLYKTSGLTVHYDLLKSKDETLPVITYNDRVITNKEIKERVEELRQGVFPNPTEEELNRLVKDMAIKLVLEERIKSKAIVESSDYKTRLQTKINYYLINLYIDAHKQPKEISDSDIKKFYAANRETLFTFKMENNSTYVQPLGEVTEFIKQKLDTANEKDARYELYKKLVNDFNLSISNEMLDLLMRKTRKVKS